MLLFVLGLLLAASARADGVAERIRQILETEAAAAEGHLGILITDAATGEIIFEKDSRRFFVPASNTKLFTSSLALARLGPRHTFRTVVIAGAAPDRQGRISGPVYLVGGGDPNFSARAIPYRPDPPPPATLQPIEDLADQIAARGVTRISGGVIGDDTRYPFEPHPPGWTMEDAVWAYGAPVSALTFNDNALTLTLQPGDPARLLLDPPVEYFLFDNRVTVGSPDRLEVERPAGSRQLRLTGQLDPQGTGVSTRLAVDDPAEFAAAALRDALLRRGIRIEGGAGARHWWPGRPAPPPIAGVELAARESPPLLEGLKVLNKVSQNLHAELMLCAAAHAAGRAGTRAAGRAELESFLAEAGISTSGVALADGSGLTRRNLVTPAAVHALLRYWHESPLRETWMNLLPVGGEDGTLRARFRGTAAAGRVRAKTGTLSRVAALSGYLDRADGSRWIFSILANFQPGAPAALIDKIVVVLLD